MRKAFQFLFIALFFMACAVPGLGMLLFGGEEAAANEVLAPKPAWTDAQGNWNPRFFAEAGDCFADRFPLRHRLITADSALKAALFHSSSQSAVTLGEDGWLFYTETLEDFTGARQMEGRQAFCIARSLRLVQDYAEGQGARFVFTVAPNKLSLYPQYGPRGLQPGETSSAALLAEALEQEGVAYADLFAAFAAQDEILYHRWDSHWNYRGAALAHDALLNALSLPGAEAFQREGRYENVHVGDLFEMLYPASPLRDAQWQFSEPFRFSYEGNVRSAEDLRIKTASDGENGSLLMFRDSFGNTLHSLMAESFSPALFSRATPYDLGLLEEAAADCVVLEIVERNISRLGEAPFVMPAPAAPEPLPEAEETGALTVQAEEAARLAGYSRLTGTVQGGCDDDSPLYLQLDTGACYEAFPVAGDEGEMDFCAYLPDSLPTAGLRVLYRQNGRWLASERADWQP